MYKITKSNGTVIYDSYPNWVKYSTLYNSFICCSESDAECVLLQEGEGEQQTSNYYNIGTAKYPQFDIVTIEKVVPNK